MTAGKQSHVFQGFMEFVWLSLRCQGKVPLILTEGDWTTCVFSPAPWYFSLVGSPTSHADYRIRSALGVQLYSTCLVEKKLINQPLLLTSFWFLFPTGFHNQYFSFIILCPNCVTQFHPLLFIKVCSHSKISHCY